MIKCYVKCSKLRETQAYQVSILLYYFRLLHTSFCYKFVNSNCFRTETSCVLASSISFVIVVVCRYYVNLPTYKLRFYLILASRRNYDRYVTQVKLFQSNNERPSTAFYVHISIICIEKAVKGCSVLH